MSIFNLLGASGGGSGIEVVAEGKSKAIDIVDSLMEMPIPISDYKVGDILYVQNTQTTTQYNRVYGIYLYITQEANTSKEVFSCGTVRMGSSTGVEASGYLDNTRLQVYIRESSYGSYIRTTSSSYVHYGTYNVLLLRLSS